MAYQFDAQHADGLAGEAFLDALFSRWYRIRPASAAQQRRGIDRWFRTTTRRLAVEYKTDHTAARTGNAFVETVSVDTAHKPGWAYTSQADYLVYYIPPDGLVYVLRFAVLRRELKPTGELEGPGRLSRAGVVLDQARREVTVDGQPVRLSPKEYELLAFLMGQAGRVRSREEILAAVWGTGAYLDERTVDVHIRWLRTKIEADPAHPTRLLTVRGSGYKFSG